MDKASGEFSLTVVTILGMVIIAGILAMLAPKIGGWITAEWNGVSKNHGCGAGQVWNGSACVATETPTS